LKAGVALTALSADGKSEAWQNENKISASDGMADQ